MKFGLLYCLTATTVFLICMSASIVYTEAGLENRPADVCLYSKVKWFHLFSLS